MHSKAEPGTVSWLIGREIKYGGIEFNVPRNKVSIQDPRTKAQIAQGGMVGGDRMLYHGYAKKYSQYILPYVEKSDSVTLVEYGILKGTGIAVWCDLFPEGRILGFDIDLGHIINNMDRLKSLGAFKEREPELYEFDQFLDNTFYLMNVLEGATLDICIDDGFHSSESIITTMKSTLPFLSHQFVYFIEDNRHVHREIRTLFPQFYVESAGELTIVSNK